GLRHLHGVVECRRATVSDVHLSLVDALFEIPAERSREGRSRTLARGQVGRRVRASLRRDPARTGSRVTRWVAARGETLAFSRLVDMEKDRLILGGGHASA